MAWQFITDENGEQRLHFDTHQDALDYIEALAVGDPRTRIPRTKDRAIDDEWPEFIE